MIAKKRARSFHRYWKLGLIVLLRLASIGAITGFALTLIEVIKTRDPIEAYTAIGLLMSFVLFRIWAFFEALHLHCPLCHGTILHSNKCHKHRNARDYLFLGYFWSAVIDILIRGTFCCMYCGTSLALRKKSIHRTK